MNLNFDALTQFRSRVQKPDRWNKYRDPVSNLLYAVLLQAALDSGGYYDGVQQRTGIDAREFLDEFGALILNYLRNKERWKDV